MPYKDELIDQIAQLVISKRLGYVWCSPMGLVYAYVRLVLAAKQCKFSILAENPRALINFKPDSAV